MNLEHVDIVGVAGLLLAIASLALQYKLWRDEHRERVCVKVEWGRVPQTSRGLERDGPKTVLVEVVNIGRVPVYVREVVIERNASGEPTPSFGEPPKDGVARMEFKSLTNTDEPLQVGQSQQYMLPEHGSGFVEKFVSARDAVLLVRSARGVVGGYPMRQIVPLLLQFVEQARPGEERVKKQLQESAAAVDDALRQMPSQHDSHSQPATRGDDVDS